MSVKLQVSEQSINGYKVAPIETVKKGDFFKRMVNGKPAAVVYSADGYCRYNKKYCGTKETDFCSQTYIKKGTLVHIDFEY